MANDRTAQWAHHWSGSIAQAIPSQSGFPLCWRSAFCSATARSTRSAERPSSADVSCSRHRCPAAVFRGEADLHVHSLRRAKGRDPAKIQREIEAEDVLVELFGDRDIGGRDGCETVSSLPSARPFAERAGQCVHDLVGVGKRERHRAADLDDVVVRPVGAHEYAELAHAIDHEGRFVWSPARACAGHGRARRRGRGPIHAHPRRSRTHPSRASIRSTTARPRGVRSAGAPRRGSPAVSCEPATHAAVLPPKVLKNSMPLSKLSAMARVVITAPIG